MIVTSQFAGNLREYSRISGVTQADANDVSPLSIDHDILATSDDLLWRTPEVCPSEILEGDAPATPGGDAPATTDDEILTITSEDA